MHFHAPLRFVVARHVLETREIEIGVQFAIDSRQQILVECRRYARGIVVGRSNCGIGFSRSVASSNASPSRKDRAHFAQKLVAGRPVEISDRAAEKKNQQTLAVAAPRRHFLQPVQIGALETDDAHHIHLAKLLLAAGSALSGNIDRVVVHALPPGQRFEQPARFLSASAAEFRHHERLRADDQLFGRVPLQQAHAGAAQPVLGQQADHVEERRPHFIVQIFRRKLFLPGWLSPRTTSDENSAKA